MSLLKILGNLEDVAFVLGSSCPTIVPASADIEGLAQELVACTPQQVFTDIDPDGSVISRAVQEHLHRSEDNDLALEHRTRQLLHYTHNLVRDTQAETGANPEAACR
ncbi:hypothetical protein L915_02783 [Phytophthora nicotianae]|nr:hypothetical protein L915_02783 [Phytophthora nicotianae]ETO82995.1 hypothetical protein F444_02924 [Phytophthora nicotianae P1976]